jgi:hypothetical protein
MAGRITDAVIAALQHCRLKAFFQLRGDAGVQCGYERLLIEQRANAQRRAMEKIRREYGDAELALQLRFLWASESMGNHDSKIVDAGSVD